MLSVDIKQKGLKMKNIAFLFLLSVLTSPAYGSGEVFVDPIVNDQSSKVRGFVSIGTVEYLLTIKDFNPDGFKSLSPTLEADRTQIGASFEMPFGQTKESAFFFQVAHADFNQQFSISSEASHIDGSGYSFGGGVKSVLLKRGRSSFSVLGNYNETNWKVTEKGPIKETTTSSSGTVYSQSNYDTVKNTWKYQIRSLMLGSYYNYRATKEMTIYGGMLISPYGDAQLFLSFPNTVQGSIALDAELKRMPAVVTGLQHKGDDFVFGGEINLFSGTSLSFSMGKVF